MALEFSTAYGNGYSAGTQLKAGPDSLCREIPACYTDENERWVLEESGWVNFGWDVSPEEEKAFARGQLPPGAFAPHPPVKHEPAPAQPEAQATAQDASHFIDIIDPAMVIDAIESSPLMKINTANIPLLDNPKAYTSLPDVRADPRRYLEEFYSSPQRATTSLPALPYTHATNRTATPRSYMSTPTLSPSGSSTCSSDYSDWESELCSAAGRMSCAEPSLAKGCGLDIQLFAQPFPAGRPLPTLFFPSAEGSMEMSQAPAVGPSIAPALMYGMPMAPSLPPTPGPSRTPSQRYKRSAKPYTRKKTGPKKSKPKIEDGAESNELICQECGYVQAHVAGARRTFKRHLETHRQFKQVEWRCRGIPQPDGIYYGGCNGLFARKDALQRHIKTSQSDCISDFKPCEVSYDAEPFETWGF